MKATTPQPGPATRLESPQQVGCNLATFLGPRLGHTENADMTLKMRKHKKHLRTRGGEKKVEVLLFACLLRVLGA